jgi:hypothetical protein
MKGFCFSLSWCSHITNHPQEGLAKFAYRTNSTINIFGKFVVVLEIAKTRA